MGVRPLIRRARIVFRRMSTEGNDNDNDRLAQNIAHDVKKDGARSPASSVALEEIPDGSAQHGVQDVEAVTMTWSRGTLIAVFIKYVLNHSILCCAFNAVLNVPTYTNIMTPIAFGSFILRMRSNLRLSLL